MPLSSEKILVVLHEDDVAPRFDLAMGVYVALISNDGRVLEDKTLVMPKASAEDLCRLILTERITTLICGGIEQEYFDYLAWKQIRVIDSVIGNYEWAVQRLLGDRLRPGDIHRP
ncbi:MAG TPA: dinitrogenase iron-molybdenum cofactor biosynthesis protein [Desulfonatronum sp.]|nr:dinitrogenase iron-molybdenum cofactor biosynthesis protein [Desulfonatronum sp.]